MNWKQIALSTVTCAALAAVAFTSATAQAGGDATGSLGDGGLAKGDISMTAGETDRISVNLVAGATVDVSFSATFSATLVMTDPDAQPVDLGSTGGSRMKVRDIQVAKTGTYSFAISSSDGSQGIYTLSVQPRWAKSLVVSGTGYGEIDVPMPASGKISAVISRERNAPGQPRILSLFDPSNSDLLKAPIEPKKNTVKLGPTAVSLAGNYRLIVTSTDGGSNWNGSVKRVAQRVKPTRISLSNGLDAISFADDGVDNIFKRNCAPCHSWAGSYAGVRAYAANSYGKIKAGSMPPAGRLQGQQISLIQSWIQTGKNR